MITYMDHVDELVKNVEFPITEKTLRYLDRRTFIACHSKLLRGYAELTGHEKAEVSKQLKIWDLEMKFRLDVYDRVINDKIEQSYHKTDIS